MRLRDLFSDDAAIDPAAEAAEVTGIAMDSRAVKPGDVFFALAGHKTDGARFIDQAIASGAAAVAGDHLPQGDRRVPFVTTANPRRALALAAARFYPRQPETIVAVTGTSGKTSVAAFARQIWQRLGHASASIGTIGLVSPKRTIHGSLTTPDPIALHRQLDEIAREGVTHLALRGLLAWARPVSAGWRAGRSRRLHQPVARPHGLPSRCRALPCRQAAAVPRPDRAGRCAVISADHDCTQEAIDAARARSLRIVTVGSKGDGAGEGIGLIEAEHRWLCAETDTRASRPEICGPPAAGRRIPDRECIGRSRARDRHRQRAGPGVRGARASRRRQGPARAGRRTQRRADLCRLRAQARCPGRRRCRRCGLTPGASSSWCSAPAATAMPASAR